MAKKSDDKVVATLDGDGMRDAVKKRTMAAAKKEWAEYQKTKKAKAATPKKSVKKPTKKKK